MLKAKLYCAVAARVLLLLVFTALLPVFLTVYVVCLLGEWYINFYTGYVAETKQVVTGAEASIDQLNTKQ